jgi:hypothetical protein
MSEYQQIVGGAGVGAATKAVSRRDAGRIELTAVSGMRFFATGCLVCGRAIENLWIDEGTEGKLFRPMALTVLFALAGSLVISLTLMPVLAATVLSREEEHEPLLMRVFHRFYQPLARLAVHHPVLISLVAAGLVAASVPVALRLGAEFMPRLDEGDLLVEMVRLPSATLEDSVPVTTRVEQALKALSKDVRAMAAPPPAATVEDAAVLTENENESESITVILWFAFISESGIPPTVPVTPEIVTKDPVSASCVVPRLMVTTREPLVVATQLSVFGVVSVGVVVRSGVMSLKVPPASM